MLRAWKLPERVASAAKPRATTSRSSLQSPVRQRRSAESACSRAPRPSTSSVDSRNALTPNREATARRTRSGPPLPTNGPRFEWGRWTSNGRLNQAWSSACGAATIIRALQSTTSPRIRSPPSTTPKPSPKITGARCTTRPCGLALARAKNEVAAAGQVLARPFAGREESPGSTGQDAG